jgi:DNA-binding LacI/PurR family transcriptional regulator
VKRARFTLCDVARQAGVKSKAIARSLATGCTHTPACLVPNLTDFTFTRISEGAEAGCRQHGFSLTSSSAPGEVTIAAPINGLVSSQPN